MSHIRLFWHQIGVNMFSSALLTSLRRVRERLVMGTGLAEAERTGGWGEEEEEDDVRMGGEAEEERVGGWGEEAASTGGEEEEEEEEWGGGRAAELSDFPSASRWEAPFSSTPGRSTLPSALFAAMVSKALSMLSLSPLRSENQQSTSVLDSLVSWASWSAAEQSSVDQRSYVTLKWKLCFWEPGNSVSL